MSSKNFLETLYESGISLRELLHLYISESHEQVWDDGLQEMFERRVLNTLVSGEYLALGYSADSRGELVAIPPHRWRFLELDIIEGKAKGEDVRYTGIKCLKREALSEDEQKLALMASLAQVDTTESDTRDSESFEALNAKAWSDITLRFLKNDFVEVGGPDKKIRVSLERLDLMNRTKGKPNVAFDLLLKMAKRRKVSSKQKQSISRFRRTLEEKFKLPGDPFQFEEQRRYVPNFKIIDDRNAADERAKNEAVFTTIDDNIDYVGDMNGLESSSDSDELVNQDDLDKDYDHENDPAGEYLRENDR